ncbi:MAG: hypothetical protein GX434_03190 [Peptococcaceae bacterium]|nr:hypothetical protein [Peptococcaceae bacterium]
MTQQTKRLYAIIIITVFCLIIVTGIGNFRAKQLAVSLVGDNVTQAVSTAAKSLDGEKVKQVISSLDEKNPYYAEMRKILIESKNNYQLENIYMLYKDQAQARWFYVVDAREEADPAHTPLGKTEKRASAAVENTIRGKAVHGEHHVTSLGTFVSSYQEIKDQNGKTFAVLAGDFNAGEMTGFLYLTRYAQIGIIALGLLLIGATVFLTQKKQGE